MYNLFLYGVLLSGAILAATPANANAVVQPHHAGCHPVMEEEPACTVSVIPRHDEQQAQRKKQRAIHKACRHFQRNVIGRSLETSMARLQKMGWRQDDDNALEWHKAEMTAVLRLNIVTDRVVGTRIQ